MMNTTMNSTLFGSRTGHNNLGDNNSHHSGGDGLQDSAVVFAAGYHDAFVQAAVNNRKISALATYCDVSEEIVQSLSGRKDASEYVLNCSRADRDFWLLLQCLDSTNLLKDIDDHACDKGLQTALADLDPKLDTISTIEIAYQADDRIKKGRVLKKWIEDCARDRVVDIPKPNCLPLASTLSAIKAGKQGFKHHHIGESSIASLHPDAQVSDGFAVLKLHGVDQTDQENLLRLIWQLIRSGQLKEAEAVAMQHDVYWLSAALRGATMPSYCYDNRENFGLPDVDSSMWGTEQPPLFTSNSYRSTSTTSTVIVRKGNLRWPIWQRTCWKYAEKLATNSQNWAFISDPRSANTINSSSSNALSSKLSMFNQGPSDCLSGILDMSIYGALSNNTNVSICF
jgi:hypothetical protein